MEFNELIEARRSVRRYEAAELAAADIEAVVADALAAPSWNNREPTRYHAVVDASLRERLRSETFPAFNAASSANAGALVVVTFVRGESGYIRGEQSNELGEMWGAYDAGIATAYLLLAAKNRGLDSLVIGIRDAEKIRAILGIPAEETIVSVVALGKGAQSPAKPPRRAVKDVLTVV